ncbi:MAG: hypothetical protein PWQ55_1605 [Chloroflexota bacterium]|nr:hypothetical protein [Chloroflexota bacterium]
MTIASDLIRESQKDKLWSRYCGHLDLSIEEYMKIQERLLFEEFDLLKDSKIGKHFYGKTAPKTVQEFRDRVPLTTYDDYIELLNDRDESLLPKGNYQWAHTSGRTGVQKWIPLTDRMYERYGEVALTAMILSSAKYKGEVRVEPNDVLLLGTAPLPYSSGYVSHSTADLMDVRFVPPIEVGEKMDFGERIATGFRMGMDTGVDYFYGLASVLGKMGERFEEGGSGNTSLKGMKFKTILRMLKGLLIAKSQHRNVLPKDIWKLKGVMAGGTDTDIYRERVAHFWGREPLEGYASTEGGMQALQAWNYKGMTLFPDVDFYEFIPFEEHLRSKADPSYTPKTVLTDELVPGIYELVFTNLLGGVIMRYRIGDLITIESIGDDEIGCQLPQFRFYSRGDDLIDLGNMIRFTEKSIWQSIEAAGIENVDWTAKKESRGGKPILHLYIEFKPGHEVDLEAAHAKIEEKMIEIHPDYIGMREILGENNLEVSALPAGAFNHFMESRRAEGADLAHLKPPHMQPKADVFEKLVNLG